MAVTYTHLSFLIVATFQRATQLFSTTADGLFTAGHQFRSVRKTISPRAGHPKPVKLTALCLSSSAVDLWGTMLRRAYLTSKKDTEDIFLQASRQQCQMVPSYRRVACYGYDEYPKPSTPSPFVFLCQALTLWTDNGAATLGADWQPASGTPAPPYHGPGGFLDLNWTMVGSLHLAPKPFITFLTSTCGSPPTTHQVDTAHLTAVSEQVSANGISPRGQQL